MMRVELRQHFSAEERLRLAENDLDTFQADVASIRRMLVGILVSTTSAAVMLAINIAVQVAGR